MVFRSKIDIFYVSIILIVIFIIGLVSFSPLFLDNVPFLAIIIITSIFLFSTIFILWTNFLVKYVFYDEYLFIKGGPFRSRIPYESITRVSPTNAIFYGHRILSSRDAIEIFNKTTFSGSIKISPLYKQEFITEIKKRCPNVQIAEK